MNTMLAIANAVPPPIALGFHAPGRDRRHCVGGFCLVPRGMDWFNALLEQLGRTQGPIDHDQLATAGRTLSDCDAAVAAACIGVRMRRAAAVGRMLADPGWAPACEAAEAGAATVGYVRSHQDLIPDSIPRVGRLDDAVVVDTAWPRLAAEVVDYADYRRLRRVEAALRGRDPGGFRFTRADWIEAREAEAALVAHRRRVRETAYAPAAAATFRIH